MTAMDLGALLTYDDPVQESAPEHACAPNRNAREQYPWAACIEDY